MVSVVSFWSVCKKKSGLSCGAGNDGGILWKSLSLILNFG